MFGIHAPNPPKGSVNYLFRGLSRRMQIIENWIPSEFTLAARYAGINVGLCVKRIHFRLMSVSYAAWPMIINSFGSSKFIFTIHVLYVWRGNWISQSTPNHIFSANRRRNVLTNNCEMRCVKLIQLNCWPAECDSRRALEFGIFFGSVSTDWLH